MRVLHLVACVSMKLDRPAPARHLYCSPWFKAVRARVEHEPWAILSARYGLAWPDEIIEPYEETLNSKPAAERRLWGARVLQMIPSADRYVVWAGRLYAEQLESLHPELPLKGLGIGQQLSFLLSPRGTTGSAAAA